MSRKNSNGPPATESLSGRAGSRCSLRRHQSIAAKQVFSSGRHGTPDRPARGPSLRVDYCLPLPWAISSSLLLRRVCRLGPRVGWTDRGRSLRSTQGAVPDQAEPWRGDQEPGRRQAGRVRLVKHAHPPPDCFLATRGLVTGCQPPRCQPLVAPRDRRDLTDFQRLDVRQEAVRRLARGAGITGEQAVNPGPDTRTILGTPAEGPRPSLLFGHVLDPPGRLHLSMSAR